MKIGGGDVRAVFAMEDFAVPACSGEAAAAARRVDGGLGLKVGSKGHGVTRRWRVYVRGRR